MTDPLAGVPAFDCLEAIEARFHIDGPFSDDDTIAAAQIMSALVRYLNHATMPGRTERSLPFPGVTDATIGALAGAIGGMSQLFRQLAGRAVEHAWDPRLYADELRPVPAGGAPDLARIAAAALGDVAARLILNLEEPLRQARRAAGRLGYRDQGPTC